MKNKIVAFSFALITMALVGSAFADVATPRRRPASSIKPSGGLMFSAPTGKHICILNDQQLVSTETLEAAALDVKLQLHAPIEVIYAKNGGTIEEKIEDALKNDKSIGVLVAFVEDPILDSISFFPERGRCIVNVQALTKDGADKERVANRAAKEVWRSIGMVLGAGESVGSYSILQRVTSLKQLDAITAKSPSPEQHNRMVDSIERLGIKMIKVGTYRDACRQGWAPAPTNEVQQAIWNEIHAIPAEPIKIKYEKK